MTLTELQQVKKDIDNNVIVSKETWMRVLNEAIDDKESLNGIWSLIGQAYEADFFDKDGQDMDVDFHRVRMLLP